MDPITIHVMVVIFVATLIRSVFGFGEALVAVPLLALRIPVGVAAPLAVLVSVTVAGVIVAQDWRKVHVRSAGGLVLATLAGVPLGVLLLTTAGERLVKAGLVGGLPVGLLVVAAAGERLVRGVLAVVIVAFSTWSLVGRSAPELKDDHAVWLLACGFCGGVLGGAYGMNGPPLVIYGAMRRWSA